MLLTISGATTHVAVQSGDGLDLNGSATITGCTTLVQGRGGGGGAGSLDVNGSFPVAGGTLVALGGTSWRRPPTSVMDGWPPP